MPGGHRYNLTVIDVFYALPFHGQFGVMVERATCVQHDMDVEDIYKDAEGIEEVNNKGKGKWKEKKSGKGKGSLWTASY